MDENIDRKLSEQYCARFGKIAVDLGFITAEQLKEALTEQIDEDLAGKLHRNLGTILFEKGWMNYQQIEQVLNKLFKK